MQSPSQRSATGRTLLVVDWSDGAAQALQTRFRQTQAVRGAATGSAAASCGGSADWEVLNCPAEPAQAGAGRTGWARARLALRYLGTACQAAWRSRGMTQVVVWQQAIGYLMCLLPRWPGSRLIITTVLFAPSNLPPHSLRRACLRLALWRADALVYFSQDLAQDTRQRHPALAHKVFCAPLPHFDAELEEAPTSHPSTPRATANRALKVFAGGSSERDFDVVIRAFQGGTVPVTLVCRADQAFEPPGPVGPAFSVYREVSHDAFDALVRAADVAVVALKSAASGCGQLLFTFCMRHGIPVIATDCHGTRDYVVHEQTGLLVPVGDAHALREAYERLTRDPALRHRLTAQARAQCEQRGLAGFVRDIQAIAAQLAERAQSTGRAAGSAAGTLK